MWVKKFLKYEEIRRSIEKEEEKEKKIEIVSFSKVKIFKSSLLVF